MKSYSHYIRLFYKMIHVNPLLHMKYQIFFTRCAVFVYNNGTVL